MDLQAHKDSLLQQISSVQDASIIQILENILHQLTEPDQAESHDWWNELSPEQQQSLDLGIQQAEAGDTVSSEEVHKRVQTLFNKK